MLCASPWYQNTFTSSQCNHSKGSVDTSLCPRRDGFVVLAIIIIEQADENKGFYSLFLRSWDSSGNQLHSCMSVAKKIVSVHGIEMTLLLSQKMPAVLSERSWSQWEGALILLHRAQRRCLGWMEAARWKQELLNTLLIFLGFPSSAGSFPEHMCQRALLIPVPAERASFGLPWTDAQRDLRAGWIHFQEHTADALELKAVLYVETLFP